MVELLPQNFKICLIPNINIVNEKIIILFIYKSLLNLMLYYLFLFNYFS